MRRAVLAALAMIMPGLVIGAEGADPGRMFTSPGYYEGESVKVRRMSCVDDRKNGFICLLKAGGGAVMIDAVVLGAKTNAKTAAYILAECVGSANLTRNACRFDVETKLGEATKVPIDTPQGSMIVTRFPVRSVDLFRSR